MILDPAFLDRPIAHRALHDVTQGRAENSRKAITAAIEAGYGIEIDLQLSRDGVPMVFHDYSLDRLTDGSGLVSLHSAAELASIRLKHDGDGIPTLADVLDQVGGQVPLLIEIKDQDGVLGQNIGSLGLATAQLLNGYAGRYAVMSFNPHVVAQMRELLPNTPRGLVTDPYSADDWPHVPQAVRTRLADIPDYDTLGCCFISHNVSDLQSPRVAELRASGATILCWTVRSPQLEETARKVAHNITFESYLA